MYMKCKEKHNWNDRSQNNIYLSVTRCFLGRVAPLRGLHMFCVPIRCYTSGSPTSLYVHTDTHPDTPSCSLDAVTSAVRVLYLTYNNNNKRQTNKTHCVLLTSVFHCLQGGKHWDIVMLLCRINCMKTNYVHEHDMASLHHLLLLIPFIHSVNSVYRGLYHVQLELGGRPSS